MSAKLAVTNCPGKTPDKNSITHFLPHLFPQSPAKARGSNRGSVWLPCGLKGRLTPVGTQFAPCHETTLCRLWSGRKKHEKSLGKHDEPKGWRTCVTLQSKSIHTPDRRESRVQPGTPWFEYLLRWGTCPDIKSQTKFDCDLEVSIRQGEVRNQSRWSHRSRASCTGPSSSSKTSSCNNLRESGVLIWTNEQMMAWRFLP